MLELNAVTRADFRPQIGEPFELITGTGGITLTLQAVEDRGGSPRVEGVAFALIFQGAPELRVPQGIYALQNAALGQLDLFLVQIGATAQGSTLEAVFN